MAWLRKKDVLSYDVLRMPFVNLQDRSQTLDFLDSILDYLSTEEKEEALALLGKSEEESLSQGDLADRVTRSAILSWPARRAVQQYVFSEGSEDEWRRMLDAVRPATAFLLKRTRERLGVQGLSELMATPGIESALHGQERTEIELLQPEIWADIWHDSAEQLVLRVEEANRELEQMHVRLEKLERFLDQAKEREVLEEKIQEYKDRIYFGGEVIPFEQLDEELRLTIGDVLGQ